MLIRAQNKLNIVNLKNIDRITIEIIREESSSRRITAYNGDDPTLLGDYITEQRAIEVLDDICKFYTELNYVDRDTARGIVENGVYQMLEE